MVLWMWRVGWSRLRGIHLRLEDGFEVILKRRTSVCLGGVEGRRIEMMRSGHVRARLHGLCGQQDMLMSLNLVAALRLEKEISRTTSCRVNGRERQLQIDDRQKVKSSRGS